MHVCIVYVYTCVHASMFIIMYVCIIYACVHTYMYICNFEVGFRAVRGIVLVGRGIVRGKLSGRIVRGECLFPVFKGFERALE